MCTQIFTRIKDEHTNAECRWTMIDWKYSQQKFQGIFHARWDTDAMYNLPYKCTAVRRHTHVNTDASRHRRSLYAKLSCLGNTSSLHAEGKYSCIALAFTSVWLNIVFHLHCKLHMAPVAQEKLWILRWSYFQALIVHVHRAHLQLTMYNF